jgi:hypothetical protein
MLKRISKAKLRPPTVGIVGSFDVEETAELDVDDGMMARAPREDHDSERSLLIISAIGSAGEAPEPIENRPCRSRQGACNAPRLLSFADGTLHASYQEIPRNESPLRQRRGEFGRHPNSPESIPKLHEGLPA